MKKDCSAIGCYDRYNCQRYNLAAEPNTYKLIIPEVHNPGDEDCPSYQPFIDTMYATGNKT